MSDFLGDYDLIRSYWFEPKRNRKLKRDMNGEIWAKLKGVCYGLSGKNERIKLGFLFSFSTCNVDKDRQNKLNTLETIRNLSC